MLKKLRKQPQEFADLGGLIHIHNKYILKQIFNKSSIQTKQYKKTNSLKDQKWIKINYIFKYLYRFEPIRAIKLKRR